ncbi:MAG: hypothetical protein DRI56_04840 [Chloroflexota bacterium]|nr:MAG: hypothetical protein DRI56_04840 [Chloroflexota bacterium]
MTTRHISEENLMRYICRTLSDAERESFDKHLSECPICRGRLNVHELRQRQIGDSLESAINEVSPSQKMNFAAIAPRLQQRSTQPQIWRRLSLATPIAMAVGGLVLAFFGLWQNLDIVLVPQLHSFQGPLSTLSCFCFIFVSMGQFDQAFTARPRFIIMALLTSLLWAGTLVIGLLNILVIRDLVLMVYLSAGHNTAEMSVAAILAVLISALIYIAVVIGGAEYHYKHIGCPSSWKLFSWTIMGQLFIMVLPYFL